MSEVRRETGFTIVELMIVIAVMAILVAIAFPTYKMFYMRAKTTEAVNNMGLIRELQVAYRAVWDTYLTLQANPPGNVPLDYQPWGDPGGNWDELNFATESQVRYQYSADVGSTGDIATSFIITAQTDFDGAGAPFDTWTLNEVRTLTHTDKYK